MTPLLSICIPTYNRASLLETALESIVSDPVFQETDKVEIIISDNCSPDNTQEVGLKYQALYPDKIRYIRLSEPVTGDENFIRVLNEGKGKYLKLNNDRVFFKENTLSETINLLENNDVGNVLFFLNEEDDLDELKLQVCHGFDEFMKIVSYKVTWIGGFCVKSQEYHSIIQPNKYSHLHFGHMYIISELLQTAQKSTVIYNHNLVDCFPSSYTRDYNFAKVFGNEFNQLLRIFIDNKILSKKTYRKVLKDILLNINFIFRAEVSWNRAAFKNYFRYCFPVFGKYLFFYTSFISMLIKTFVERFFCVTDEDSVKLVIFGRTICSRKKFTVSNKNGE